MQLYVTHRSPFARKARIVLLEKRLPHEVVAIDLAARPPAWFAEHPIGKIPVLVLDGVRVPDSTVICETLEDRFPDPPMYEADRLRCRILDELADTAAEHAVAAFFARQRGDADAVSRASDAIDRVLGHLAARQASGDWPPGFTVADAALIAALGYLGLRHGPGWRDRHPALAAWFDGHAARPSVAATVPILS